MKPTQIILPALMLLFAGFSAMAQNTAVSAVGQLNVVKEVKPPILDIVSGSLKFVDFTENRAIDANENCRLVFEVKNSGMGDGYNCVAKISATGSTTGLTFHDVSLPPIMVNSTQTVEIPISAGMNTADGRAEFSVYVVEPNGMGTDPVVITIETRAFDAPHIQISDYSITGTQSTRLEKKKPFDLQILVQNTQHGLGENVTVEITLPKDVMLVSGQELTRIGTMTGGNTKSLEYTLIATNNYTQNSIPVAFKITERYGKYAENRTLDLAFNQTLSTRKIDVDAVQEERGEILVASLGSDVDKNIPKNSPTNTNTFAFIIANENYQNSGFAQVPFALRDGEIFKEYCVKTLGMPQENVRFYRDMTYGGMRGLVNQIQNTANVNKNIHLIVYYAGHGAPNEQSKNAFLVPVDAYQVTDQICYNLQTFYDEIQALPIAKATIFIDACFSGTNRDNTLLAMARGVKIKPKQNSIAGNMVIFSAASDDETALPYDDQSHGLFTYYLLKKLQETSGNVTYEELSQYIFDNVRRTSNNVKSQLQTPTTTAAPALGDDWKSWRLRD